MKRILGLIAGVILLSGVTFGASTAVALQQNIHTGEQAQKEGNVVLGESEKTDGCYDVLLTKSIIVRSENGDVEKKFNEVIGYFESCSKDYEADRETAIGYLTEFGYGADEADFLGFLQDIEENRGDASDCVTIFDAIYQVEKSETQEPEKEIIHEVEIEDEE